MLLSIFRVGTRVHQGRSDQIQCRNALVAESKVPFRTWPAASIAFEEHYTLSLGFTWAGTVIGERTRASYHSALWVAVAIGVVDRSPKRRF